MDPWLVAAPVVAAGMASYIAYGAAHPRSQIFGPTLFATGDAKKLAITFDDGPNPAITPKLLDLLDQHGAKATFFLIGKYVRASPSLAKEIAARGHLLGNHTDSHPDLFFCGPAETRTELLRCGDTIEQATWIEPRWFRPPFGHRSPWAVGIAQQQNLRTVMWTRIPGDWRMKSADWLIARMQPIADRARQNQPSGANQTWGDVLCLHDGNYSQPNADRVHTLKALEYWLPRWRDLGLEFVTISQAAGKAVEA
jgi:peptidoglycan-N-acetylglucosamine deacetylase